SAAAIVCHPPADVTYVTEQLLLLPMEEPSVQLDGAKLPPPEVEKLTVPTGGKADAPDASETVTVHVVLAPWTSEPGVQLTLVVVPRVTVRVCALVEGQTPGDGLTAVIAKLQRIVTSPAW